MTSQSAPPSARVFHVDVFSWVIDELVCVTLERAVFVTDDEVFLGDMECSLSWRRVTSSHFTGSRR